MPPDVAELSVRPDRVSPLPRGVPAHQPGAVPESSVDTDRVIRRPYSPRGHPGQRFRDLPREAIL